MPKPRSTFVVLFALLVSTSTAAQQGSPGRRADSGDAPRHDDYTTSREDEPGTIDPFEHTAFAEVGFYRTSSSSLFGSARTALVPMRFGFAFPAAPHVQVRANMGLAGAVVDTSTTLGTSSHDRYFHPGNLALGAYYAFGGREKLVRWTVGAGGQLVAPTSQNPDMNQAAAHQGAQAVYGLLDRWLYLPETMSIVPGVYGRFAYRFLFANLDLDLGFGIRTDSGSPTHSFQLRVEGGLRMEENWRLGVAFTNVQVFGPGAGSGDNGQSALRVFVRADIKMLTFGCELVMNLDKPYGFAFDSGGVWGIVSRVGVSL